MPRKRPNPFAPPSGSSDTVVPGNQNPRNFSANVTKGGVKRGPGIPVGPHKGKRTKAYTGKQTIAKVPNRYIKRLKKKRKKNGTDSLQGGILGRDKGMYRKTDAGYKKRRFTFDQRQKFRARRQAPSWGPDSGRPKP